MLAVAVLTGIAATVTVAAAGVSPVSAATLNAVATIANANTDAPLASGGSKTPFTVTLPPSAACSGDTASDGYHVYSYLVPKGTNVSSVTFIETPSTGYGFVNNIGTYYGAANTAATTGQVISIPNNFQWAPLVADDGVPLSQLLYTGGTSGIWEAGLACANSSHTLTDNWNTEITFKASSTDATGFVWSAVPGTGGNKAPAVTSVSPTSGPTTGGTNVTITGTGFTGATKVTFGTTAATSFSVVSATQITAVSPPSGGTQNIRITTPSGTSPVVAADDFTYTAAKPAITGVNPTSGPTTGGTTVTITGTGFTGATAGAFATVAATSFTVVSATSITAVSPVGSVGAKNIRVTTPSGTSPVVAADDFTYTAAKPAVTGISPTSGPTTGGTTVTITGTSFTGATKVTFATVAAPSFTVVSATTITAVSPPGAVGPRNVQVTTPQGTSPAVAADDFTYTAAKPAVTGVSPASGPTTGRTTVTITGTAFTGATKVTFGTTAATSFTVVSATQITAVSPPGGGTQNIRITTPSGTSPVVAADDFTYSAAKPAVTGVSPTSGSRSGGTTVTITGTGFTGATKVAFGTTAATSFTVVSATKITAVSPAAGVGTRNIQVTTAQGTSPAVAADDFTYTAT
jgi:hypothetical protein